MERQHLPNAKARERTKKNTRRWDGAPEVSDTRPRRERRPALVRAAQAARRTARRKQRQMLARAA